MADRTHDPAANKRCRRYEVLAAYSEVRRRRKPSDAVPRRGKVATSACGKSATGRLRKSRRGGARRSHCRVDRVGEPAGDCGQPVRVDRADVIGGSVVSTALAMRPCQDGHL
jgi:hypothetical protein